MNKTIIRSKKYESIVREKESIPLSFQAPSIWKAEVAAPIKKFAGKVRLETFWCEKAHASAIRTVTKHKSLFIGGL
jgi:hypothetical protein